MFDMILANPPFAGKIQKESILADINLETRDTELLFLKWFIDHLNPGGRAGVIVPNGVLFGSNKADHKVRELLLTQCDLQAVINLPSGIFKPYSGVGTAALIFEKGGKQFEGTKSVWFYDLTADGFSLDDKRTPIEKNDIPDVLAKGPEKLLPGCSYSIDFALSVVRDKYEYHLPLERQTRAMEALRLKGVGTKTLYNLCEAVSVHLEPVVEAIRKDILSSDLCVHMDETPWPIQGKDDDGYMWILSNQAGSLYRFEPTRSGKIADEMLGDYEGPLLSDAYNGYDRFKKRKGIQLGHCWAHGRRKFFEIREIYPESEEILDFMENLFAIEREAKTYEELEILRREKSKPVVDQIYLWLVERKSRHLPESAFTKGVDYMLKRRREFTAFLLDTRIPLSNNEAERTVRHAVMGRKNFYGSKTINGADTAAILYTVIESCKKVELDPTTFLRQAIVRNNHKQPHVTPLQFARELRKSPP